MKKIIFALSLTIIMVVLAGCGSGSGEKVYVYSYGDYFDPELIEMFKEETGIEVILDTYDTCEEMYPVIKNNSASYDVLCPSDYMIERLIEEELLSEINFDNVPNIKNIGDKYLEMSREFDPENKYSVPHTFGTAGILYNTEMVGDKVIDSWEDLWEEDFAGEIVMQDSIRDTFMVAEKILGYSLNTVDEEELKEASELLKKQKPLVYKYANDSARDILASESAALGVIWNGEYLYALELNDKLDFVVPKEGSQLFVDSWVITKTSENKENAEAWINFMCREDVAKKKFEYLTYSCPNVAAQALLDEDILNNEKVFLTEEMIDNSEVLKDLGPKGNELYSKYWKQFKAE